MEGIIPERSKNGAKKNIMRVDFFSLLWKKRRKIKPTTEQTRQTDQYITYIR